MMLSEIIVSVAADTSGIEEPQTQSDEKPVQQVQTIKDKLIEKQEKELIDIKVELQLLTNTFDVKCTEASYLSKGYAEEKRLRRKLHNDYVEARTDANELVEINTDLTDQLQHSKKMENKLSAFCEEKESLIKKKEEELMNLKVQYHREMTFKKDQSLREKLMNKNIGEKLGQRNKMITVLNKERKLKKQLDQSYMELTKDYDLLKRESIIEKEKTFNLTNQVKKMQDRLEALENTKGKELEDLKMKHEEEISMIKEETQKMVLAMKDTITNKTNEAEQLMKELEIEKQEKDDIHKAYVRICKQNTEANKTVTELTNQLNEQNEQLRVSMAEGNGFKLKCEELKELLKREDDLKNLKVRYQEGVDELRDKTEEKRITMGHERKYFSSEFACYQSPRHGNFISECENGSTRISEKDRKVLGNANGSSVGRRKRIDIKDRVDTGYWSSTSLDRTNGYHGNDSNIVSTGIRSRDVKELNLPSFYADSAHRLRSNGAFNNGGFDF